MGLGGGATGSRVAMQCCSGVLAPVGCGTGRNCIPCSNREEKGPIGGTSQR